MTDLDEKHVPTTSDVAERQPVGHVEQTIEERIKTGKDSALPANHPVNAMGKWRKFGLVFSLSYAGFLCNFSIAIANVAFGLVGESFGVGPGAIANALGYNLLGCALGSVLWNPVSQSVGHRPVYLIGSFIFMPICVWQAQAKTYHSFVGGRVLAGIVTSWSQTIPPSSIANIYVKEVRGSKMSAYAICTVIGPVIVPIFAAAIVRKHSWRNLWYFNLGLAALQFLLVLFLVPETTWNWDEPTHNNNSPAAVDTPGGDDHDPRRSSTLKEESALKESVLDNPYHADYHTRSGHVGATFLPHHDWPRFGKLVLSPIIMFHYIVIVVPSFYYGMCLGWLSVGITVVFPQIFAEPPFSFGLLPLGAAFLAFGIGGVLGKWSGGIVSDKIVAYFERKNGQRQPEDRLWAGYPMLPLMFLGLLLCGLGVQLRLHWMCYLVGGAICFFSLSGITTVILTYTLETYITHGMDTQAVFNFCKYMWGFVVPFFLMDWGLKDGWIACYCAQGAILAGGGFILLTCLIWKGFDIRKWQNMPTHAREHHHN